MHASSLVLNKTNYHQHKVHIMESRKGPVKEAYSFGMKRAYSFFLLYEFLLKIVKYDL